jgi:hypothetical protein
MIKVNWIELKSFVVAKSLSIQFVELTDRYELGAGDGTFEVRCTLDKSPTDTTDLYDFETNFKLNGNKSLLNTVKLDVAKTTTGIQKVSIYEPEGESATIVSHNFSDPCSWYQGSVKVTEGTLTNVSGNIFSMASSLFWIDLQNGRLYDEDNIMSQTSNEYKPKVYIDNVLQSTGYSIDYPAGQVTFDGTVSGTVTATFYKADKSWFILKPKAGKILSIKAAEVQFCKDTTLNGPFMFEAWVNHPTYGLIPVPGSQIVYKNFKDFISACNQGQGLIPQIGDLIDDVHVFPFDYARPKPIKSSQGVEIRVYCKNHLPCGGSYATSTFYVAIDNEVI